jgi:hypothetical protein
VRTVGQLDATFGMLANVEELFEGSRIKHRLRRIGFEFVSRDERAPFQNTAFFGDAVLTPLRRSALRGTPACESDCVVYFGVVARALVDRVVVTVRAGRPELQAGIALSAQADAWKPGDDKRLEDLRTMLGDAWTIASLDRPNRITRCLAARLDIQHLVDTVGEPAGLEKARDDFFWSRWQEMAGVSIEDYKWLRLRAVSANDAET